jgi:nucleotide-binding universal stress UspA family protein
MVMIAVGTWSSKGELAAMYKRILVPLDGSQLAECSLSHVKSIAAGCGVSEVVLLTVTEGNTLDNMQWVSSQTQIISDVKEKNKRFEIIKQSVNDYLEKVGADLTGSGLTVKNEIIEARSDQHAADVILDYADRNQIDLIIISTHGRSGVSRWAFGSEADKVVRSSRVPVLTIAAAGCRI